MSSPSPDITLRPWRAADAPRMAALVGEKAVYRFLAAGLPTPYTEAHAAAFIEACAGEPAHVERAVVVAGEAVGTVGAELKGGEGGTALIGFWLGEAYWRRGIMGRALPLFISQLPPQVAQLRARVFDFNPASQALLRRCGFREVAGCDILEPAKDGALHRVLLFARAR